MARKPKSSSRPITFVIYILDSSREKLTKTEITNQIKDQFNKRFTKDEINSALEKH